MSFSFKLPAPPEGVEQYIIAYIPFYESYRLYLLNSSSITLTGDSLSGVKSSYYSLEDGAWVMQSGYSTQYALNWYSEDPDEALDSGGYPNKVIVFSTADVFDESGSLLLSFSSDTYDSGATLIGNSLTASQLLSGSLSPLFQLTSILVPAVVLFLCFRKAWSFLRGHVRGA